MLACLSLPINVARLSSFNPNPYVPTLLPAFQAPCFLSFSSFLPPISLTLTYQVFQLGSGVIGNAAGESIFSNRVIQKLAQYAPGTSATAVLEAGASELQSVFGEAELQGVRRAYLAGIHGAWILTLALCGAAVVAGVLAPPISIAGKTGVRPTTEGDGDSKHRPTDEMGEEERGEVDGAGVSDRKAG